MRTLRSSILTSSKRVLTLPVLAIKEAKKETCLFVNHPLHLQNTASFKATPRSKPPVYQTLPVRLKAKYNGYVGSCNDSCRHSLLSEDPRYAESDCRKHTIEFGLIKVGSFLVLMGSAAYIYSATNAQDDGSVKNNPNQWKFNFLGLFSVKFGKN